MRAAAILWLLVVATGCTRDALVVVAVDAALPLEGIARLHVRGTVGTTTREHDVAGPVDGRLPATPPFTFGLYVAPGLGDSIMLVVEALDGGGTVVAGGRGSAPVRAGARSDTGVTLAPGAYVGDGGPCVLDSSALDDCTLQ